VLEAAILAAAENDDYSVTTAIVFSNNSDSLQRSFIDLRYPWTRCAVSVR